MKSAFRQQRVHILKRGVHRLLRVLRCAHRIRINHLHVEAQRPPRQPPGQSAQTPQSPASSPKCPPPQSWSRFQPFQFPERASCSPSPSRRATAINSVHAKSAVVSSSTPGVFVPPRRAWCKPPRQCCRNPPRRLRRCAASAPRAAIPHLPFPSAGKPVLLCPSRAAALFPGRTLCWRPVFHVACGIQYFCALPQTVRANNKPSASASFPLDFLKHYTSTAHSWAGVSRCQNAASLTIVESDATDSLYARLITPRTELLARPVERPPQIEDLVLYEYDGSVEKGPPGSGRIPSHHGRRLAYPQTRNEIQCAHCRPRLGNGPLWRRTRARRRHHDRVRAE